MKIGFIGLGNMGLPMARNAAKRGGFRLVVHTRTRSKAAKLAAELNRAGGDVAVANSPADVVEAGANVVCVCLADEACGDRVLLAPDTGVFAAAEKRVTYLRTIAAAQGAHWTPRGVVIVDHGTVSPACSRRCHARAKGIGDGARQDSAEDFSRLNALLCTATETGFSFPRIALPFHDRTFRTASTTWSWISGPIPSRPRPGVWRGCLNRRV